MEKSDRSAAQKKASIRDVASLAGVSIATVSHALGGKRPVAEATRRRVVDAADRLGYRPHPGARSLKAAGTGVLGMCVTNVSDAISPLAEMEYYFHLVTAATETAMAEHFAMVVVPESDAGDFWDRLLLDGAIIADPTHADPGIERLRARGLPVVTIGRDPDAPEEGNWVDSDPDAATRLCLDHLAERGARDVAAMTFMSSDFWTQSSMRSYHAWCAERGQTPRLEVVPGETEEEMRESALHLLASDRRPDAVYGIFELPALRVLPVARELGIDVPGELLVAASSDFGLGVTADPPMTALDYNTATLAREATRLLVQLVRGEAPEENQKLVPVRLVERESTRRT